MNLWIYISLDPLYVLTPPKRSAESIKCSLWMKLTASLATHFDVTAQTIRWLIPKDSEFVQYGRVYQLEGGDIMHARELNSPKSDGHDMSFVRVCIFLIHPDYTFTLSHISILVSAFG